MALGFPVAAPKGTCSGIIRRLGFDPEPTFQLGLLEAIRGVVLIGAATRATAAVTEQEASRPASQSAGA